MPEVVAEMPNGRVNPRNSKYPWDELFDGRVWRVDPREEYGVKAKSFADAARNSASRKSISLSVFVDDDGIVFLQAVTR